MTETMKAARRTAHEEMLERLAGNADFLAFVGEALDEFCSWEQVYGEVGQFEQGVRAAGSWITKEIAKTEAGRKALARMYEAHLSKNQSKGHDNE